MIGYFDPSALNAFATQCPLVTKLWQKQQEIEKRKEIEKKSLNFVDVSNLGKRDDRLSLAWKWLIVAIENFVGSENDAKSFHCQISIR